MIGEGGSGGAIAIALADRVLMQENAIYSVISPEGCAAILWRDVGEEGKAAAAFKPDAAHCLELGVIDAVVPEPEGGAQTDSRRGRAAPRRGDQRALEELSAAPRTSSGAGGGPRSARSASSPSSSGAVDGAAEPFSLRQTPGAAVSPQYPQPFPRPETTPGRENPAPSLDPPLAEKLFGGLLSRLRMRCSRRTAVRNPPRPGGMNGLSAWRADLVRGDLVRARVGARADVHGDVVEGAPLPLPPQGERPEPDRLRQGATRRRASRSPEDVVRGFEIEKGRFVELSDEDLDRLDIELTHSIDICDFVDLDEIDPIYFRKAYYLLPEDGAEKPYRLLVEALEETGKVGIAKVVIRNKQHLACLRT